MSSVNRVILLGHVGKDPEIRYLQSGDPVASFSLATSEKWTDKSSGEKKEKTEWHSVSVFGRTAQIVRDYVTKGSQVYVEGSIAYESWEKDGQKKYSTKIKVTQFGGKLVLLGRAKGKSDADEEQVAKDGPTLGEVTSDEIPF